MPAPRWITKPGDPDAAARLAADLRITPITAQILLHRGYASVESARRFLEAPFGELSDPATIVDLPAAADRLVRAVREEELLTVFGDYDADGVTATACLLRGLGALGARAAWYIPSRFTEGYGLNAAALERIRTAGSRLVVAVDCGVTAVDEIASARGAGQEIIVVDHHEPAAALPPALAVVDPKRTDVASPFRDYSAAGLAFQLLRAVCRQVGRPELPERVVDLAALGTIADVVPLVGDNRILARAGLARMQHAPTVGLAALIRAAGLSGEVTARHVAFSLAPRLNAAGRLGDAGTAVRLLLAEDPEEADEIATTLDRENRTRQQLCDQILTQAIEAVERDRLHDGPAIVLAGEGWHAGVIGIVASQLVERYYRPVVLMAVEGGFGKGSARSIEALHMVQALTDCADVLTRFGGHAMAAGLTIAAERIPEFTRRFAEAASARLRPDDLVPALMVDAEVSLTSVSAALAQEVSRLAPFGAGNPEPVLTARGLQAVSTRVMGDGLHLRLGVTDGHAYAEAVGFRLGDASELLAFTRARVDLAFAVAIDRWDGRERVQLIVRDLVTPGVDLEAVLADSRLLVDRLFARAGDYLGEGALGLEDAGTFYTKIVGVTFEGRQEIVRALVPGEALRLQREPTNPVDPHAIRVLTRLGQQVGFLSARVAARLAPSMDAGSRYAATVSQITGGPGADRDRSFGVNIFVQRLELPVDERDPGGTLRAAWKTLDLADLLDRLRIHLGRGRPFHRAQIEVIQAVAEGRRVLGVFGPGRGRMRVVGATVAVEVIRGRGPLVIAVPLRSQVERWYAHLAPLLAPVGIRCVKAHGALLFRQRQHLLEILTAGAADVVIGSMAFLGHAPPILRPALVLVEAEPRSDVAEVTQFVASLGEPRRAVFSARSEGWTGLDVLGDIFVRTNLRLVDRRNTPDRIAALREMARRERSLIFASTRQAAVETAAAMREQGVQAAYYHGGLPLRVREVLEQGFADGRIAPLIVADGFREESAPADLRQVAVAGLPRDRAELVEWIGCAGLDGRQAVATLLYDRDDLTAARLSLAEIHPAREVLSAIFRALRDRTATAGGAVWPDDALSAALDPVAPSRRSIGVGLDVLAEAGVIQREFDGERWRITLPEPGARRDLATSLRYTEGQREMQELAELGRLAFGPLPEILRAVAGRLREPAEG